jgi:hypothetical protein
LVNDDDDFASGAALFEVSHRRWNFGERVGPVDDWRDLA